MKLICKCGTEILALDIIYFNQEFDYEPDGLCGTDHFIEVTCKGCKEEYYIGDKGGEISNQREAMESSVEDYPETLTIIESFSNTHYTAANGQSGST